MCVYIAPAQCVYYTFWTEILKDLETSAEKRKEEKKEKEKKKNAKGAHLKDRAFSRDYIFYILPLPAKVIQTVCFWSRSGG